MVVSTKALKKANRRLNHRPVSAQAIRCAFDFVAPVGALVGRRHVVAADAVEVAAERGEGKGGVLTDFGGDFGGARWRAGCGLGLDVFTEVLPRLWGADPATAGWALLGGEADSALVWRLGRL